MVMVLNLEHLLESFEELLENTEAQVLLHREILFDWSGEGPRHFYFLKY